MDDDGMTEADYAAAFGEDGWERDHVAGMGVEAAPEPLPVICMASLHGVEIEPREWIVNGWLPSNSCTLLAGGGGTGKSLFTQQWLTAISLGIPFLGMETVAQVPTLFVNCEDEPQELTRRNADIAEAFGFSVAAMVYTFAISRAGELGNELGTFDAERRFKLSAFFAQIEAAALNVGARLVALDNVAHLYTGNENSRAEVTAFVNALSRLAMRINGAVLLLGHPAKAEGSEYSGSTGWENAVRSRLFLSRPEGEGQPANPDARVLTRGKANYAQKDARIEMAWHRGAFVAPGDLPEQVADAYSGAGRVNEIFLECLAQATAKQRSVSENRRAGNYAPRVFALFPAAKGASFLELELAMERLFALEKIAGGQSLWPNPINRHPVIGIARLG